MIADLIKLWPTFAPIKSSFNRKKLEDEIISSGVLKMGSIATSHSVNGRNFWDNGINFQHENLKKLKDVPLWTDEEKTEIIKKDINTFYQVSLTSYKESQIIDSWNGKHLDSSKIPLWIKYNHPWSFLPNINLPYLKEIIDNFNLEYYTMVRIVYQTPPSIGLIHKDSGPKTNLDYYNNGGVSITLNVSSGDASLYFLGKDNKEYIVNEDSNQVWHFDDSTLHCTDEVLSNRIQVRIYGKHKDYQSLFDESGAIY